MPIYTQVQEQLDAFDRMATSAPSDIVALRRAIGFLAEEVAGLRDAASRPLSQCQYCDDDQGRTDGRGCMKCNLDAEREERIRSAFPEHEMAHVLTDLASMDDRSDEAVHESLEGAGYSPTQIGLILERWQAASSSDSSAPGATPTVPSSSPPSPDSLERTLEYEALQVISELVSGLGPNADEDEVRDELDGNFSGPQIDAIVHRWLTGQVVDLRRHVQSVRDFLDEFDADRMDQTGLEAEQKRPMIERLLGVKKYVEKLERENTDYRLRARSTRPLHSSGWPAPQ